MIKKIFTVLATLVVAAAVVVVVMSGGSSASPKTETTALNTAGVSVQVYRTNTTPGGSGLRLHTQPSSSSDTIVVAPEGATVLAHCFTRGTTVLGNSVWENVTYNGQTGWQPDYYLLIHWNTTADLVNQGIPDCSTPGATPPQATLASAPQPSSDSMPAVWVGSPITGMWPDNSDCHGVSWPSGCSLPQYHHYSTSNNDPNDKYADWAVDIQRRNNQTVQSFVGQPVTLFAAPQNPSVAIGARVVAVNSPCASGQYADGGQQVIVGLYPGTDWSHPIGYVTYAHIDATVSAGQIINRWGSVLGKVGSYRVNGCWGGPHVHMQMASVKHYACYNKDYKPDYPMDPKNFVGFVGGDYAHASRQACP